VGKKTRGKVRRYCAEKENDAIQSCFNASDDGFYLNLKF
jgi:hypothetical protein